MQFEKPLDEDEETDEELPEDVPNPIMDIMEKNLSSSNNGGKCPIFSEKVWYYLQAQTEMPFHYLKLVV